MRGVYKFRTTESTYVPPRGSSNHVNKKYNQGAPGTKNRETETCNKEKRKLKRHKEDKLKIEIQTLATNTKHMAEQKPLG